MKNLVLVFAFILVSLSAIAQKRSDFKGPEHKNFKYWENTIEAITVYVGSDKKDLTGPMFKNFKAIEAKNRDEKITITASTRPKVKGPKFKNYKPWKNSH